jgi:hypothetical protein
VRVTEIDERYAPSEAEPAFAENSNEEYANGRDGARRRLVNDLRIKANQGRYIDDTFSLINLGRKWQKS